MALLPLIRQIATRSIGTTSGRRAPTVGRGPSPPPLPARFRSSAAGIRSPTSTAGDPAGAMKLPPAAAASLLSVAATSSYSRLASASASASRPGSAAFSHPAMSASASASAAASAAAASASAAVPPPAETERVRRRRHPLEPLSRNFDHSWIEQLNPEGTENRIRSSSMARCSGDAESERSNRCSRPVFNGHFVEVPPTPLRNPRLVIYSSDMAERLGLSEDDVRSEEFVKYFSGDVDGAFASHRTTTNGDEDSGLDAKTWATPYALSIMGTRYTSNCPYGTGDGYGDGRAISIGEVVVPPEAMDGPSSPRYELQLKGAGRTPFCRGADGRAVLRSSVREFLASEAMHHLGIKTTRALSLIVSDGPNGDTSRRPWYSGGNRRRVPKMNDPRLAKYDDAQRRQIISQIASQSRSDPDVMIEEPNAITCRAAPSFVRVGHIDLFSRRATAELSDDGKTPKYDTSSAEWDELEKMIWHAAYREFPRAAYEPFRGKDDIAGAARALLDGSMEGISAMVAGWVRVGFTQGNFNADNCLVGGRTMDYGPFGFVDEYHPLYAKWTGSGEHFGFMNQPSAGFANYAVLVESVMPVIYQKLGEEEGSKVKKDIMDRAQDVFQRKMDEVFRTKLGFAPHDDSADPIWRALEPLMRQFRTDWTMFWRQLTEVARQFPASAEVPSTAYGDMLEVLVGNDEVREGSSPFHEPLGAEDRAELLGWIQTWREALVASAAGGRGDSQETPEGRMARSNPKYVLREWMLVEAYTKASEGDESMIGELSDLIRRPYDEGTEDQIGRYYRRAPDESLAAGGTAYMS